MLGNFELMVLIAVERLGEEAYGVTIRETLINQARHHCSLGAVYSTLQRLEKRGLVRSFLGEATRVRGGRAKRHYALCPDGRCALEHTLGSLADLAKGTALWPAS